MDIFFEKGANRSGCQTNVLLLSHLRIELAAAGGAAAAATAEAAAAVEVVLEIYLLVLMMLRPNTQTHTLYL